MDQVNDKIKIGIVGAGISGCSAAYFLNEFFGDKVEIVVFESTDIIGGRLATFTHNDRTYELGGSILHSSNSYMKSFLKICDLEKKDDDKSSDEYLGFYDANNIVFEQKGDYFGLFDKLKSFQHFGFFQLIKLTRWVSKRVEDFSNIYKLQDNGFTFKRLDDFLNKLHPELYHLSQTSLRKSLESKKFNDRIINEISSLACLSNYGQSVDINGFVGIISLAGTVGDLWSVKNGNKLVPAKLLEKSQAQILKNTTVKLITKDELNPGTKNMIVYQTENKEEIINNSFDYVIVSFPIHDKIDKSFHMDFNAFDEMKKLKMQFTNTYIISGKVKLFPNLPVNKRIQLHSVDKDVPYRCISVQLPTDYNKKKDSDLYLKDEDKIYKIFAEKKLDSEAFDEIFESGYKLVTSIPWLAYPKYDENPESNTIPAIILDSEERSRVYYSNAIEWSSSCMEICCIQSRNIALLIANKEKQLVNPKRKRFFMNPILKSKTYEKYLHTFAGILSVFSIGAFILAVVIRQFGKSFFNMA